MNIKVLNLTFIVFLALIRISLIIVVISMTHDYEYYYCCCSSYVLRKKWHTSLELFFL